MDPSLHTDRAQRLWLSQPQGRVCHVIGSGCLTQLSDLLDENKFSKRLILITDSTVAKIHAKSVLDLVNKTSRDIELIEIPAGEANKNLAAAESLYTALAHHKVTRDVGIIALGGG